MKTDETLNYINTQEKNTNLSWVRIGDEGADNLVISFASTRHFGFERKKSLVNLRSKNKNFDILYIRNFRGWYLGSMHGIGYNTIHTIAFFKKIIKNYNNIISIGDSMGGYGAMLYGSLLDFNTTIAVAPQTDMNYVVEKLSHIKDFRYLRRKLKNKVKVSWSKYAELKKIINTKTQYKVYFEDENTLKDKSLDDQIMHGMHHYNQIQNFSNVSMFKYESPGTNLIESYLV